MAAADLTEAQQQRLSQYVRDLGGALAILGGDRAFAAGAYQGTRLEALAPLASTPPNPTMHWILLADGSGSMSEGPVGATRWDLVCSALLRLRGQLPPEDPVTIGSFAEDVRWWSRGRIARETLGLQLPPADVSAHGPTNLEPALLDIIAHADAAMPKQLLILSDADADIAEPARIATGLKEKKISLHLLDTYGKGRGAAMLRQLRATVAGRWSRSWTRAAGFRPARSCWRWPRPIAS